MAGNEEYFLEAAQSTLWNSDLREPGLRIPREIVFLPYFLPSRALIQVGFGSYQMLG